MNPMLACDWDESKVRFPVYVQPKIDGVRALNFSGKLTARSLKTHKNIHVTKLFSIPSCIGFDGEMAAASETDKSLCRITTSAVNTIQGEPYVLWHLFDYIGAGSSLPYSERYQLLLHKRDQLWKEGHPILRHLRVVPSTLINSMSELVDFEDRFLTLGYEGVILRRPDSPYKHGRCTVNEGYLLRIKRFVDREAIVLSVEEGRKNENESVVNELGFASRSSHSENMIPNGMVGALICKDLESGETIKVAAGKMSHSERIFLFANQGDIIGKVIKYKTFLHGIKDKPRFPTFQCFRALNDM